MYKIGLIDNDLCTRKINNFPNLALMKLSSWHKSQGDNVKLINFEIINPNILFHEKFDLIYVAKVFTDTKTPNFINNIPNLKKGGSGFYFDRAEKLPYEIEHIMPDYNLYQKNVIKQYIAINKQNNFTEFSIGFTTRGCIRRCPFCINKNERLVYKHSELSEFIDESRDAIMLLDDNIMAYEKCEEIFEELNNTGKPFVYKQGIDFRLLDKRKMEMLYNSNYYSTAKNKQKGGRVFHFAFDNYADRKIIEENLKLWYENKKYAFRSTFYVLVGFDRKNIYNQQFFKNDFNEMLLRFEILFKWSAHPYIMFHANYKLSPFIEHLKNIRNIINVPMYYASHESMLRAFEEHGYTRTIDFLLKNYPWFLKLKFNNFLFSPVPNNT